MISTFFKTETAKFIDQMVAKADVIINNVNYVVPVRRTIVSGTIVRKHIYLTQNDPVGTVTRARLLDKNSNVLDTRTDVQIHESGKGLLLEFKYTIQEG